MISINNKRQSAIDELLNLRYPVVALKLIEKESVVPSDALCPYEDKGRHIALCQAIAMTRREGKTVYMRKEDHWCWKPVNRIRNGKMQQRRSWIQRNMQGDRH